MSTVACKFFARGICSRGSACLYSHEDPRNPWRSELSTLQQSSISDDPDEPKHPTLPKQKGIPCRYYIAGTCNKGDNCPFAHEIIDTQVTSLLEPSKALCLSPGSHSGELIQPGTDELASHELTASNRSKDHESRDISGASVTFGPGAQLIDLQFPSDFSNVQISFLRPGFKYQDLINILETLEESVPSSCIRVRPGPETAFFVANIKIGDPRFGQRLKSKATEGFKRHKIPKLEISILQVSGRQDASANRLQLNSVSCTWYKASRLAWLHYGHSNRAKRAEAFISSQNMLIDDRKISTELYIPTFFGRKRTLSSVRISNLAVTTLESTISSRIPHQFSPLDIVLGEPSYNLSVEQSGTAIKLLLQRLGPLESWSLRTDINATQVKATARFVRTEDARKAVSELGGSKLPVLGNSTLHVNAHISVKFSVLPAVYSIYQDDINGLEAQMWNTNHVHIKVYMPAKSAQRFVTLHIHGEDAKHVSRAKHTLEKLLAGDPAMDHDAYIWDGFFEKPAGLQYLHELSRLHHGYIYRDNRKHRLSLFGSHDSKDAMQKALIAKSQDFQEQTHYIELKDDEVEAALTGGFRRIVAALGKQKVALSLQPEQNCIKVIGSPEDLETARLLLVGDVSKDAQESGFTVNNAGPECCICWTEAENPYRTHCDHHYCRQCFIEQCSSASSGDIPIRCMGATGGCSKIFSLVELRAVLPSNAFEQVLSESLATHIRTHPQEFQHCPTPDCEAVYRITTDGTVFNCTHCLTGICTTCHVTSHDGTSCAEYQRIANAGDEEFDAWKRENDVRDCPECKAPIQKLDGCNHIDCRNCKTHICWFCMKVFPEERDCYGHMSEVHNNWGLGVEIN